MYLSGFKHAPYLMIKPDSNLDTIDPDFLQNKYVVRLSGKPVSSAGELEVLEGILKEVTNKSGHYQPSTSLNNQFLKYIKSEGIDIDDIVVTNIN